MTLLADEAVKDSPSKAQHQYSNNMSSLDVHCLVQLQSKPAPSPLGPASLSTLEPVKTESPKTTLNTESHLKVTVKLKPRSQNHTDDKYVWPMLPIIFSTKPEFVKLRNRLIYSYLNHVLLVEKNHHVIIIVIQANRKALAPQQALERPTLAQVDSANISIQARTTGARRGISSLGFIFLYLILKLSVINGTVDVNDNHTVD